MYVTDVFFAYQGKTPLSSPQHYAVNQVVEQWRYNGQIIGREIPLFNAEQEKVLGIGLRVICPEQSSLLSENNNLLVNQALAQAEQKGLQLDSLQIVADDLNSDQSCFQATPSWQMLYTTYLHTSSPLHSGDNFLPIPLYKQLKNQPHLSMDIIKWQENWQACDQLQMNGAVLESQALHQLCQLDSPLAKHGYALVQQIEQLTHIPTYYYLYRLGGQDLASEQQRCCPKCQQSWRLASPLFEQFYFKCDTCRLISNLSWNYHCFNLE
ncbi:Zn-ribbon-containing protein [Volucribacter amazonae]|uniref:Uncharacterized protein n=1 Tax=Volucribacter amazonae TaxID=256731 RepID=A0A9X4PCX0_9PAST|nr:Zn-ribbon-containing protein [Volucribacter amazonae]MDG6895972.1 hypothetical protein [Volucribacter amazonae]